MSKAEILAELSHLSPEDLAEVQAKLDQLAGATWQDRGELSATDREALDKAIASYESSPHSGSSWAEVKARVEDKLRH